MISLTRRLGESSGYWMAGLIALLVSGVVTEKTLAGPRWVLVYYRQMGNQINANNQTFENHLFNENGSKAAGIALYNQSGAFFGTTDSSGYRRVTFDEGNCAYDVRVSDPAAPSQQSPTFYWFNPTHYPQHYSYVTQWMRISDDARVTAFPQTPVYHYDQVNGINQVSGLNGDTCVASVFTEPSGANTDARALYNSANYQAQTFVVPANINRIISAQSFLARGAGEPNQDFDYDASIHQGSPTGPQIGPTKTYIKHFSVNFKEEAVCWGVNDVPVTPGLTYALKLTPRDGQGTNVYACGNNYAGGTLYNGTIPMTQNDMVAVVVGIKYDDRPTTLVCNPTLFDREIVKGDDLASDTFTVANGGGGTLSYTVQESVEWLSVDPTDGVSTGEADSVTVTYTTKGLAAGSYTGIVTVSAPAASPPSRAIVVNLTVGYGPYAPCDFDKDGDVDQVDFGQFQTCVTGVGVTQPAPACKGARLDSDLDVDAADFELFVDCMSGPGTAANPACVP